VRVIFFDFGGVLLQHMDGIDHRAIEGRFDLPEKTLMRVLYRDSLYAEWQTASCTEAEYVESIRDAAVKHIGDRAPEVLKAIEEADNDLNPQMVELVKSLHGRYTLGIISNTRPGMEERIQQQWPWMLETFDIRIGSGDVRLAKPDPAIFHHALSEAGAEAAHSVFTDDNPDYAEVARNVGMHGFHFTGYDQFAADLRGIGVSW
jgi:HAD superfamily hydrolase (TIGR01509 family)